MALYQIFPFVSPGPPAHFSILLSACKDEPVSPAFWLCIGFSHWGALPGDLREEKEWGQGISSSGFLPARSFWVAIVDIKS